MEHNCKNSFYLRENGYIFESYETLMLYVDDFDRLQHTRYEFTYQNLLFGIFNHLIYSIVLHFTKKWNFEKIFRKHLL